MRTLLGVLMTLVLIFAATSSGAQLAAKTPEKIRIAGVAVIDADMLPIAIAMKKGFYEAEGLDVEFVYVKVSQVAAALEAKDIDVALWLEKDVLSGIEKGLDFRIIMGLSHRWPLSLVVSEKIKSIADLDGKLLGVNNLGFFPHNLLLDTIDRYNKDNGTQVKVNFMGIGEGGPRLAALAGKSIDGTYLTIPPDSIAMKTGKFNILLRDEAFPAAPAAAVFVRAEDIARNRAKWEKFIGATLKGRKWLGDLANTAEAKKMITDLMQLDKFAQRFSMPPDKLDGVAEDIYNRTNRVLSNNGCVDLAAFRRTVRFSLGSESLDISKYIERSLLSCWK